MSSLLDATKVHARDVMGQAAGSWGMHLMESAFPVVRTVVGIPAGAAIFVAGWAMQFVSHTLVGADVDLEFPKDDLDEDTALILG
jgi:hypothetical protein